MLYFDFNSPFLPFAFDLSLLYSLLYSLLLIVPALVAVQTADSVTDGKIQAYILIRFHFVLCHNPGDR